MGEEQLGGIMHGINLSPILKGPLDKSASDLKQIYSCLVECLFF